MSISPLSTSAVHLLAGEMRLSTQMPHTNDRGGDPTDVSPSLHLTTDATSQLVAQPLISGTAISSRSLCRVSAAGHAAPRFLPPSLGLALGIWAGIHCPSFALLGRFEFETMREFSAPLEFCIFGHRPFVPPSVREPRAGVRQTRRRGHLDRFFRPSDFGWSSARAPLGRRRRYCRRRVGRGRSHSVVRPMHRVCASLPPSPHGGPRPCPACLVTWLCAQIDASCYLRCALLCGGKGSESLL